LNTHNLDEAERLCDRIGILNTKLIAVDSPRNLERSQFSRKTVIHLETVTAQVLTALKKLGSVKNVRASDNKLIIDVENPEKDNPELVRAIVTAGGSVQYVTELKSSLEDVYLKLIREAQSQ
jgi:ABC-2 type transport system ATP-binding protein